MSVEGGRKVLTGTLTKAESVVVPVIQKNSKKKKQQPGGLCKGLPGLKKSGYPGNREDPHTTTEKQLKLAGKVRTRKASGVHASQRD